MGERHVGVEDGSGVENTVDKLANGGGSAVCHVDGMCHGLFDSPKFVGGIMRTLARQV